MSAEQTPDIADIVARVNDEHGYTGQYHWERGALIQGCRCGADVRDQRHREHEAEAVAAALAPVLAAAVREAEQRTLREAIDGIRSASRPFETGLGVDFACAWLRDRADRVAVDAPEGGEGR